MRRVILESPLAGNVDRNVRYARAEAMGHSIEYRRLGGEWAEG